MQCPKCGQENPQGTQFCSRCHTPLRYTCPACKHVQSHGGKCDQCRVDFTKYAAMLMFQAKTEASQQREQVKSRGEIIKQILLLPVTGGLSLFKFFRSRLRGE